MNLQIPIFHGYTPEEKFTFKLNGGSTNQTFFKEGCEIAGSFKNETLRISIGSDFFFNPIGKIIFIFYIRIFLFSDRFKTNE